jgi:hypothetical protein
MIDQLKNAVQTTVERFQKHPTHFLSERDIQALLFVELRNATNDLEYHYDPGGKNLRFGFTDRPKIHPITTEYHLYEGQKDRFDIAVLSEEQDSESDIWRQPCRIAIEIKLWQPGYGVPKYGLDVEKLQKYQKCLQKKVAQQRKFMGIAMLFVHPRVEKGSSAICDAKSGDAYPEDGVALHLITQADHWWKQVNDPVFATLPNP